MNTVFRPKTDRAEHPDMIGDAIDPPLRNVGWAAYAVESMGLGVVITCLAVVAVVEFVVWAFTRRSLCDE